MGTSTTRTAGIVYGFGVFNFALSASKILSLYRNGISQEWKWGFTELIFNSDRLVSETVTNFADVDLVSGGGAFNITNDLTITAGASGAGDYCILPLAALETIIGYEYYLRVDVANLVGTWDIKSYDGTQTIGTITATGTSKVFTWVASTVGGLRIVAVSNNASVDLDNFFCNLFGCTFVLNSDSWKNNKPYALTYQTGVNPVYPTSGWSFVKRRNFIENLPSLILYPQVFTVVAYTTDVAVGDGQYYFVVPYAYGGMSLKKVGATVITAGVTGNTTIQLNNLTNDFLSTVITIEDGKLNSYIAATPPVINATYKLVSPSNVIRVDVDSVSTTPPKGLIITLEFGYDETTLPATPYGFHVSDVTASSITLTWEPMLTAFGYRLYRCLTSGGTYVQFSGDLRAFDETGHPVTSITNFGLASSTTYYYKIRAFNGNSSGVTNNWNYSLTWEGKIMQVLLNNTFNSDGESGKQIEVKDGAPFTLRDAIKQALLAQFEDERNLAMEEKVKRYDLYIKVKDATDPADFTSDEIVQIKKVVEKAYSVLIVGQAVKMLEGK
jgi:hypothetical protein